MHTQSFTTNPIDAHSITISYLYELATSDKVEFDIISVELSLNPEVYNYEFPEVYNYEFNKEIKKEIQNVDLKLKKVLDQIDMISQITDRSITDYEIPSEETIGKSKKFVNMFVKKIVSAGYKWFHPITSTTPDGYISLGWNINMNSLYLNIKDDDMYYQKIDVVSNSEITYSHTSELNNDNCLDLWKWITDER